jgi:ParB family chromosome partitioning protein
MSVSSEQNSEVIFGLFMAFQGDSIYWVEVEKVVPNPFQPRREFDQNKLQELADSIRMYGVLQPLTVTRSEVQREDGTFYTEYELIAGERRLRASKLAGTPQVPVIIREGEQNEQEKLELAIIENLQREDLNAVDRAIAFKQLAEVFGLSHALVAKKVGRSREYVSNSIRLLGLPEHMLESLKHSEMMEGHARTLLMLTDRPEEQQVVYKEILLKKLSVREVERIVRKIATDKVRKRSLGDFDANLIEMEKQFTETLGTRVQILKTDFGGKLTIDYFTEEDLEEILNRVKEVGKTGSESQAESINLLNQNTPIEIDNYIPEEIPELTNIPDTPASPSAYSTTETNTPTKESFDSENQSDAPTHSEPVDYKGVSEVAEVNQAQTPVVNEGYTPEPVVVVAPVLSPAPVFEPAPIAQSPQEDDSNLYSINRFTI